VVKGTGKVVSKTIQYIGVPLTAAGIAIGGGVVGTVIRGGTIGRAVKVGGKIVAGTTMIFGNIIAGGVLVGGSAGSVAIASGQGLYYMSKSIVVPSGYLFQTGVVLSYESIMQLGAHSILAVADCAYLVLSLEGPRWVIYAIKGNLGKGEKIAPGTMLNLKKMQKSGEVIKYVPVANKTMKRVIKSTYRTLPTKKIKKLKPAVKSKPDSKNPKKPGIINGLAPAKTDAKTKPVK
jgi:hypothetical protein